MQEEEEEEEEVRHRGCSMGKHSEEDKEEEELGLQAAGDRPDR